MKDKFLIKFKDQNNFLCFNFLFSANAIFDAPMQTLKMVAQPHLILLNIY